MRSPLLILACATLFSAPIAAAADDSKPSDKAQPPERITVYPQSITLAGARSTQGLRVTAHYAAGVVKDVTDECDFRTADEKVLAVSDAGVITPKTNGAASVTVAFGKAQANADVTIKRIEDNRYNFKNDVLPVISRLTCNQMGCHGSPKGKKRLQLSLFSADPHKDYLQITDAKKGLIDPATPDESWLLLKATCYEDHGGGELTEVDSPEYNLLLDWIKNKAPEASKDDPELVRVEVFPPERKMLPGEKQKLLVEAYFSDGTMRDVTSLASFKSNEEAVAKADDNGVVEATGYGEAVFMVGYGWQLTTTRVTSSQPAKVPFPELQPKNRVDALVLDKLRSLNVIPSELCSDAEFLRRAHLDVIGLLPTVEEARAFLADKRPDKRARLIDDLLQRPEYADFYALKWGDILQINRDNPARLQDKGMWAYYRWLWNALDQNKPMDQFVHEVLTARGSGYRNGPANFFRVGDGPQGMAEHASTAFLGVRLDCAHCHNHPFEQFTLTDNLGMAAFFSKVRIKRSQEQDEEIIYLTDSATVRNPETNQAAAPKFLGGVELAAAERAAAAVAEKEKKLAEKVAAEKAALLKSAVAKAKSAKAAADKAIASKSAAMKKLTQLVATAKSEAKQAVDELASAEKEAATKTEAEKEATAKIMADCKSTVDAANVKVDAAQTKVDAALADLTRIKKDSAARVAKAQAATSKASTEKSAADKAFAAKTRAARKAAAAVVAVEQSGDPREKLAAWITSPDNPYFARHMANRAWTWLLGRGIIDEPDDFRSTNPASNPELLDYLAGEFVTSGYDMKAMFRLILNSHAYQRSKNPNPYNKHDQIHYSHYGLKRLTAEQLATAISQVTGVPEKYAGLPLGTRATQLPDVSMRSEFLDLFGRPKRATPVESERTCDTHIGQSLHMISSDYLARKLRDNNGRVALLAASKRPFTDVVDELYLATLSRYPTDAERKVVLAEPTSDKHRREKLEDLAWVLVNTKEFLFNH